MDSQHFDALTRALSAPRTRRGIFAVLAAVPMGGALLGALDDEETDAAGRRKRRRRRSSTRKHQTQRRRQRRRKQQQQQSRCKADALATTCAGTCGSAVNNCQKTVECNCGGALPICVDGACVPCSAANPCPDGCCQADGTCGATCRVFTTSTTHTGNLGGLAGGDAICQNLATAANLPGRYMAWLSDDTSWVSTRFPLANSTTVGPYVLAGDPLTTIADNWADLTTCDDDFPVVCLQHAIDLDEAGQPATNSIWTGTNDGGSPAVYFCQRWTDDTGNPFTGSIGLSSSALKEWSYGTSDPCYQHYSLYCFQQG